MANSDDNNPQPKILVQPQWVVQIPLREEGKYTVDIVKINGRLHMTNFQKVPLH